MSQSKFIVTPLIGGSYLVEGADLAGSGKAVVLYSEAWNAVVRARASEAAHTDFDAAVKDFFAPLLEAADRAGTALDQANGWDVVRFGEDVEGSTAQVIGLDEQGIILRILDEGREDLLKWAGDTLVAIAG